MSRQTTPPPQKESTQELFEQALQVAIPDGTNSYAAERERERTFLKGDLTLAEQNLELS